MKKCLMVLCVLVLAASSANAALSVGDIAFVEFNADDPDSAKFVALADLAAGEKINFTDNGWLSSGSFRSNEGTSSYTVGAGGIAAGTVVNVPIGSMAFAAAGDQILAYTGSSSSPTFIYALNDDGSSWQSNSTSSNTSALPTGLTNGLTAVALSERDNYAYTGTTVGTQAELLAALSNPANWTGHDSARQTYSGGNFTVTPEPATMALLGLGALVLRRKK